MRNIPYSAVGVIALVLFTALPATADPSRADRPLVGELRTFAIPFNDDASRDMLHHEGWLEADGRLLPAHRFQPLFSVIGRTWTPAGVSSDEFAVPDLRGRSRRSISSDNPYDVLGPGDLVSSGHPVVKGTTSGPIAYWIFTGQDLTPHDVAAPR